MTYEYTAEQLADFVNAHDGCHAIPHRGQLLVTGVATQRIFNVRVCFEITEKIPPTYKAVRDWLGY